jgi:hypothetical protein
MSYNSLILKFKKQVQRITLSLLFIFAVSSLSAQNSEETDSMRHFQRIDVSYIFGGQVYNNNFIYNPGYSFSLAYGLKLNQSVGLYGGAGFSALENERFLPVFIGISGCKKNRLNTPLIDMQIGYAFGWDKGDMQIDNYAFHSGIFIDAGFGRKIPVNGNYSLLFHWSYRHQFARMSYKVFGGQDYSEALNYDMFVISLGLIRNCQ